MLRNTCDLSSPSKNMLETLLQNRLGLKYMPAKKLVKKGRESLGMEDKDPWTAELEAECLKLYEAEHGPIQPRDYSSPEKTEPAKPSTPAPAPPKPVEEARDPSPAPAEEDTPELTPEEEEEPPKPEEPEEEPAPVAEPEPEPPKEEEPAAPEPAPKADSDDDDGSDDDDDSDDE